MMRGDILRKSLGAVLIAAMVLGLTTISALAQEDLNLVPFGRSTATITLTDSGMTISPAQLNPGPITFTVVNNSSAARGVYFTGLDRVGNPILRYSPRISPGGSTTVEFWLYQGNTYTFNDYTSRTIRDGESAFTSSYSTNVSIPTLVPIGRGPRFERATGTITITNSGISVSPSSTELGPILFRVVNESDRPRGVVITGEDRIPSPIVRYTRILAPGASTNLNFWLFEGKTYTIRDYTRRYISGGEMKFTSSFRTTLSVSPGAPIGSGPESGVTTEKEVPVY